MGLSPVAKLYPKNYIIIIIYFPDYYLIYLPDIQKD